MWVDRQGPWPQRCQPEPFLASAMTHLGQVAAAALLGVLLASQVCPRLMCMYYGSVCTERSGDPFGLSLTLRTHELLLYARGTCVSVAVLDHHIHVCVCRPGRSRPDAFRASASWTTGVGPPAAARAPTRREGQPAHPPAVAGRPQTTSQRRPRISGKARMPCQTCLMPTVDFLAHCRHGNCVSNTLVNRRNWQCSRPPVRTQGYRPRGRGPPQGGRYSRPPGAPQGRGAPVPPGESSQINSDWLCSCDSQTLCMSRRCS